MINKLLQQKSLWRYLLIACGLVALELVLFQLIYLASNNYVLGTVLSFSAAVILNWWLSRIFVFKASRHHISVELGLVILASIIGLGLQVSVVFVSVEVLGLIPFIGKALSVCFSFFWNYWFRAKFVFPRQAPEV